MTKINYASNFTDKPVILITIPINRINPIVNINDKHVNTFLTDIRINKKKELLDKAILIVYDKQHKHYIIVKLVGNIVNIQPGSMVEKGIHKYESIYGTVFYESIKEKKNTHVCIHKPIITSFENKNISLAKNNYDVIIVGIKIKESKKFYL